MAKFSEEQEVNRRQEETAPTNDSCGFAELGQVDAPADAFADQDEYIDEP